MKTFIKTKFNISDDQTNIDKLTKRTSLSRTDGRTDGGTDPKCRKVVFNKGVRVYLFGDQSLNII